MEELISVLFLSREIAHRAHLSTESYAEHIALGSFYEEVIELADSLAELYQGYECKLKDIPYYSNPVKGTALVALKRMLEKVQEIRTDVCPDYTPIQNTIDEVETLFNSTIYKLTFLK